MIWLVLLGVELAFGQSAARVKATAGTAGTVGYSISLTDPERHLLQVQVILPPGKSERGLQLPAWNALYQIRDFAQYVNWIRAKDRAGRPLRLTKLEKGRWRIAGSADGAIVEYQIFADNAGPFGAQLNAHHGFFNLAEILMYPSDGRDRPMTLAFSGLPDGWRIATPLQTAAGATFGAENYDRLVDSPVELGMFEESDFDENGGHFRVVVDADSADYDLVNIVAALHKIVAAAMSWMEDRPFEHYMFIYHFPRGPAGGGMEHAYATAIDVSADSLKNNLPGFEGVTAHEFFHLWNVKRIRPQSLEPVDYGKENYTRALWFCEGVTSTAEGTILLRAGLTDEQHYRDELAGEIAELQRRPSHLTQSAEESSLDAWLEGDSYYRRPERSISYYNKGELLGVMLDLAVREASSGRSSLREVIQWLNQHYAKNGRFFPDSDGVREASEAVSHKNLNNFFEKYVSGTEEIPWNDFFRSVGLTLMRRSISVANPGFAASRNFDGPMIVSEVVAGSEASRAGLRVGDTVIEIRGKAAGQDSREDLARMNPGDTLELKVHNERGDQNLSWKVGGRQEETFELNDLGNITPAQRARRVAWLKGEAEAPEAERR